MKAVFDTNVLIAAFLTERAFAEFTVVYQIEADFNRRIECVAKGEGST